MARVSETKIVESFITALREAGVTVVERRCEESLDALRQKSRADALLRLNDHTWLVVEVARSGYPRDIREGLWRLQRSKLEFPTSPKNTATAILADHLTASSREMLKHNGCAYFDLGGSLYLKLPEAGLLIDIERPPPKLQERRANSIFTGAREQVVHALLHQRDNWCSGVDIASAARTSPFTVSQTISELERLDWVESKSIGPAVQRRLSQPGKLLDAWSAHWLTRNQKVSRWYQWSSSTEEMLHRIAQQVGARTGVVLTGAAAANQLSPWLTGVDRVDLIVPPEAGEDIARELELKAAEQGSNISLLERSGASTLFDAPAQAEQSLKRASPFILYLDLLDGRGRNKELAQQLRTTVIKC
jgi:hypothetical protein